ncbi:hypothetical protein ABZ719_12395 [Streptomyces sp. NPDC006743]|uniref:hypothetical protein n=1 Tax=Streptomyces sp. NPDC006743 TaxID=3154480 RepID=UPI003455CBE1
MNEDDCFPLLLSQRERSTFELGIHLGASKTEEADFSNRHELPSDEDLPGGFPDATHGVPVPPDASRPVA